MPRIPGEKGTTLISSVKGRGGKRRGDRELWLFIAGWRECISILFGEYVVLGSWDRVIEMAVMGNLVCFFTGASSGAGLSIVLCVLHHNWVIL